MNSRATNYLMRHILCTKQNRLDKQAYISQISIPDISPEAQAPLVSLVDEILSARRADPKTDTTELESALDALVFDLFGLAPEERAVVLNS